MDLLHDALFSNSVLVVVVGYNCFCFTSITIFEMKIASLSELGRTQAKVAFSAVGNLIGYDAL